MKETIFANVEHRDTLATEGPYGRTGTAVISIAEMRALFGEPQIDGDRDDKVKAGWFFKTPRGYVCVRDYWWNTEREMSIAGHPKGALWVAAYFRARGYQAAHCRWREMADRLVQEAA